MVFSMPWAMSLVVLWVGEWKFHLYSGDFRMTLLIMSILASRGILLLVSLLSFARVLDTSFSLLTASFPCILIQYPRYSMFVFLGTGWILWPPTWNSRSG